ncbi:leucyl/phenylalanyl-tRNA--protein transferase [Pedobacter metabolipauper]|uniref:Leucyl/phenylalanyl-tRNA--protein transferase n=1 Tax=Pedobacter metabolipauper TaxID=425513 RepID=A0A4R6SWD3_9SPHI|nr:leucyl/phenylalanyl-tRNA--protein transferase [Pedobacter metabolipauper]TDQ09721.1 leucyl/phenylalanyl-tRNA--protein transferase [Pedobacter metabolipauper]
MVFRLPDDELVFPDPSLADPDGMLAVGGDLSLPRLLLAYQNGIFPWFSEDDPICWYSPHERCVIYPDQIKVSKSMAKLIRSDVFKVTYNQAFTDVILNCAKIGRKDQPGTWITKEMQDAYINLHEHGYASSVEVWHNGVLAGGLYGVLTDHVFCGESMFSLESNASKTALIWLCQNKDFELIDCQLPNDHLLSLGAVMISREQYDAVLGN